QPRTRTRTWTRSNHDSTKSPQLCLLAVSGHPARRRSPSQAPQCCLLLDVVDYLAVGGNMQDNTTPCETALAVSDSIPLWPNFHSVRINRCGHHHHHHYGCPAPAIT